MRRTDRRLRYLPVWGGGGSGSSVRLECGRWSSVSVVMSSTVPRRARRRRRCLGRQHAGSGRYWCVCGRWLVVGDHQRRAVQHVESVVSARRTPNVHERHHGSSSPSCTSSNTSVITHQLHTLYLAVSTHTHRHHTSSVNVVTASISHHHTKQTLHIQSKREGPDTRCQCPESRPLTCLVHTQTDRQRDVDGVYKTDHTQRADRESYIIATYRTPWLRLSTYQQVTRTRVCSTSTVCQCSLSDNHRQCNWTEQVTTRVSDMRRHLSYMYAV